MVHCVRCLKLSGLIATFDSDCFTQTECFHFIGVVEMLVFFYQCIKMPLVPKWLDRYKTQSQLKIIGKNQKLYALLY